ncbi:receptor-like protein kinase, partial [Trifolium medium]|nr:receptor-like protein kinase [Trifolium medium]
GINDSYGHDKITGRVTELDLSYQDLNGEINFSILKLEFLSYLDLSSNYFDVINIPATRHNITHTSNLFYLDLSHNFLQMDNLDWLSPLSSLKYLNLSGIDLHKKTNWLQAMINTLPSLLELQLNDCNLNNFIINPSIEYLNLSSLVTLNLSFNNITSQLPNWVFNLTKDLTYLNLQWNNIYGEIPPSLLNLQKLRFLSLSFNDLQGSIPYGIGQLENIQRLNLHSNTLSGSIPSSKKKRQNCSRHFDAVVPSTFAVPLVATVAPPQHRFNRSVFPSLSPITIPCYPCVWL